MKPKRLTSLLAVWLLLLVLVALFPAAVQADTVGDVSDKALCMCGVRDSMTATIRLVLDATVDADGDDDEYRCRLQRELDDFSAGSFR